MFLNVKMCLLGPFMFKLLSYKEKTNNLKTVLKIQIGGVVPAL